MLRAPVDVSGRKLTVAVFKFSSCDGCQLSLLNLEDHLLALADAVEIASFLEARRRELPPPYDIGFVEGAITTPEEAQRIRQVRRDCRCLIAIGACATAGGIQALRNWIEIGTYVDAVYPRPELIKVLDTATPIASHVFVEFELRGCPVNPEQLLEVVSAALCGRRPDIPTCSVCIECKRRGVPCRLVSGGLPCMGPVTQAGCGALCPAINRACYGCFGPMERPNVASLGRTFAALGQANGAIARMFRSFNGYVEPFKQAGDDHERLERAR